MKAKIKLKLKEPYGCAELKMLIQLEDERFAWHKFTMFNMMDRKYVAREDFYNDVYDFLSNREWILGLGEEMARDILKERLENMDTYSKEKEIKRLLKELKKPIEIEVKE